MSHRIGIAPFLAPFLRLLRRPLLTPKERAPRVAVPGIGIGSCGIPQECTVIIRGRAS